MEAGDLLIILLCAIVAVAIVSIRNQQSSRPPVRSRVFLANSNPGLQSAVVQWIATKFPSEIGDPETIAHRFVYEYMAFDSSADLSSSLRDVDRIVIASSRQGFIRGDHNLLVTVDWKRLVEMEPAASARTGSTIHPASLIIAGLTFFMQLFNRRRIRWKYLHAIMFHTLVMSAPVDEEDWFLKVCEAIGEDSCPHHRDFGWCLSDLRSIHAIKRTPEGPRPEGLCLVLLGLMRLGSDGPYVGFMRHTIRS